LGSFYSAFAAGVTVIGGIGLELFLNAPEQSPEALWLGAC
jgi:hypothetical protein